jgi:alkylglycerol monooxygenase
MSLTFLISLVVPVFLLMILGEILWIRLSKLSLSKYYQWPDSLCSLACGILDQAFQLLLGGLFLIPYLWTYENFRIFDFSSDLVPWLIAFIGVDFLYYWWHRMSHEVNWMWAAHIVHHQSEEYNLTTALRQAPLAGLSTWFFYLPLAFLGVSPEIFILHKVISLLYQFWIHTRMIGQLGPLEGVLNTPSHHRVHHGSNPEYIDKNYAAIFIVWDKLFGTFQKERAEVRYGITKPLNSYDPYWANMHYWVEVYHKGKRLKTFSEKVCLWFSGPSALESSSQEKGRLPRFTNRQLFVWTLFLVAAAISLNLVTSGILSALWIVLPLIFTGFLFRPGWQEKKC